MRLRSMEALEVHPRTIVDRLSHRGNCAREEKEKGFNRRPAGYYRPMLEKEHRLLTKSKCNAQEHAAELH